MMNSAVATFEAKKFHRFFRDFHLWVENSKKRQKNEKSFKTLKIDGIFFASEVATALFIICEMENMF